MTTLTAPISFELPAGREATGPPEARGLARDEVRLLVAKPGGITHVRFTSLPDHLEAGDLLVVNTSSTMPAAVSAGWNGRRVVVHFSRMKGDAWVVELRRTDQRGPILHARAGDMVDLPGGHSATLEAPERRPTSGGVRLWSARIDGPGPVGRLLEEHGRPIRYGYLDDEYPLEDYQTVFARRPGSAEMPSAGRPFTPLLVTALASRGVVIAPVVLHAGVSSLEAHEPPQPEWFEVPEVTARLSNQTRAAGGRVIAVGTTATRSIESVTDPSGLVSPGRGMTDLVLGPDRPARAVGGLITGWHEPEASHLSLLEAVAGRSLVESAYEAALANSYLWHEFGDSCLLLPDR